MGFGTSKTLFSVDNEAITAKEREFDFAHLSSQACEAAYRKYSKGNLMASRSYFRFMQRLGISKNEALEEFA
jgi:hypothetical protein